MKAIVPVLVLFVIVALGSCGEQRLSHEEFRRTAEEAEQHSMKITLKQAEIRDNLQAYNQTVSNERCLSVTIDPGRGLCPSSLETLQQQARTETDESCRVLLQRVFDLQKQIEQYHSRVEELTASLPPPHRVRRGETHYRLSLDYLMNAHGLTRHVADSIVSRAALSGDILEGFDIWFLYDNDEFSTLVTQGKAHISPAVFAKVVKKDLMENARAQGSFVEYENILDSLKRTGALLSSVRRAGIGL
jgi:hypothetical protein